MYVCRLIHFFLKYTATAKIYTYGHTLSLHDALPILFGEYPIMINSVSSPYSSILRATASASGSATGASFSQSLAAATPTSGVTVSVSDAAKALSSSAPADTFEFDSSYTNVNHTQEEFERSEEPRLNSSH